MLGRKALTALTALFVLLNVGQVNAAPVRKDRSYYEKNGTVIWEAHTSQKMIALTFDDGPDVQETNEILDVLGEFDGKCTFFVIGHRVAQHPEVVRRIVAEGHEVANHTFNHIFFKTPASEQQVREEIERTEEEIVKATGKHSVLFRPPGGRYDDTVVRVANEMGLLPVMWSWQQDTRDWARPGVYNIVNKVLKNVKSGNIVLFHDHVTGKSQTIAALKIILPELKARGYRLVTVSELIEAQATELGEQ